MVVMAVATTVTVMARKSELTYQRGYGCTGLLNKTL